jgi:hypothetical protein
LDPAPLTARILAVHHFWQTLTNLTDQPLTFHINPLHTIQLLTIQLLTNRLLIILLLMSPSLTFLQSFELTTIEVTATSGGSAQKLSQFKDQDSDAVSEDSFNFEMF